MELLKQLNDYTYPNSIVYSRSYSIGGNQVIYIIRRVDRALSGDSTWRCFNITSNPGLISSDDLINDGGGMVELDVALVGCSNWNDAIELVGREVS